MRGSGWSSVVCSARTVSAISSCQARSARSVCWFTVATNIHVYDKIVSNIQEIRARGARTLVIAEDGDEAVRPYADEVFWVPQAPNVWFRPLLLNTVTGSWCNLLRVRKAGVLSRHIHPSWVTGMVLKGAWRYLEHDWVAREGSFVYEPPGEIHTLVVDEVAEMITFFNIHGAMVYLDEQGAVTGYEDVLTKAQMCRAHYAQCGLGADYVDQFIR